ncbi:F-box-like domain superfamily, partial [Arabidopsis thaliana x Arabidopsis arenosa]
MDSESQQLTAQSEFVDMNEEDSQIEINEKETNNQRDETQAKRKRRLTSSVSVGGEANVKETNKSMETPNSSPWSELPGDILRSVFKRLSFVDFQHAKIVCLSWYASSPIFLCCFSPHFGD